MSKIVKAKLTCLSRERLCSFLQEINLSYPLSHVVTDFFMRLSPHLNAIQTRFLQSLRPSDLVFIEYCFQFYSQEGLKVWSGSV